MDTFAQELRPLNFLPEVAGSTDVQWLRRVQLCDVTLREGEQTADAAFTPEQKRDLTAQLADIGVHEVQVGYPRQDARSFQLIKQAGIKVPLQVLSVGFLPTWREDIDISLQAGADVVCVLIRSADAQLEFLGFSREAAIERAVQNAEYIRSQGARAAFAFSFASQADLDFLMELSRRSVEAGAERIVLADSMGVARPAAISHLIHRAKREIAAEIAIHCHNDFGLAVANTLAALEAGAKWAEVSVNGLGERAGNAPLDEVVLALACLYGARLDIRTEGFLDLAQAVAQALNMPISPLKAVVGGNAFAQKLDIHVMVAAKRPEIFEPFDPAVAGNRRWLRLGKGSGPHAVRAKLAEYGREGSEEEVQELVRLVNARAEETRRAVPDEAVLDLLDTIRAPAPGRA